MNAKLGWLLLLAWLAGCSGQPGKVWWLQKAADFSQLIVHDPVDRGRALLKVVRQFCAIGEMGQAERTAGRITTWMRGEAYLEIAMAYHRQHRGGLRDRWMNRAAGFIGTVEGWPQSYLTALYVEKANQAGALEQLSKVDRQCISQGDDLFSASVASVTQWYGTGSMTTALEKLAEIPHGNLFPRKQKIVETHLDLCEMALAKASDGDFKQALGECDHFIGGLPAEDHPPLVSVVARRLYEMGKSDEGERRVRQVDQWVAGLNTKGLRRSLTLVGMSQLWNLAGEKERGLCLLEEAQAHLQEEEHPIPVEYHRTLLAIALAYMEWGATDSCQEMLRKCLEYLSSYNNLRSKALMAADLCIVLSQSTVSPDHEMRAGIDKLYQDTLILSKGYKNIETR